MDVGWWLQVMNLTRESFTVITMAAEYVKWTVEHEEDLNPDLFHDVHVHKIRETVRQAADAYYAYFNQLLDELKSPTSESEWLRIAMKPAEDMEEFWFQKNRAREKEKSWLEFLPAGSLERTYAWSAANVLYGVSSQNLTEDKLRFESDLIADSAKDSILDTPTPK